VEDDEEEDEFQKKSKRSLRVNIGTTTASPTASSPPVTDKARSAVPLPTVSNT